MGDDSLYTEFQKEDDKAMGWIADLEMEQEPYEKKIQSLVVEKSADLNVLQKMQWLLLTMSRFCVLFQHISSLPNFEEFEKLGEIVTYFSEGLYEEIGEDKECEISEYADLIEEVFDSLLMNDYTKKVEISNQESFIPADLESGDVGTAFFFTAYNALQFFIFGELDEDDIEMEFAACGILADYYYRTSDSDVKDEPKILEETERIFADYAFVKEEPTKEKFLERIENYKKIMLI